MDDDIIELLGHSVKQGEIGIPGPRKSVERGHMMSVGECKAHAESLLGVANLNYVGHRSCIQKASTRARKVREREESSVLEGWRAERKAERKAER